jgi:hypothetical protein
MAFKMNARSPLMKTLVGAQKNLPEGLKNAIEAAPESPAKNMNKGYGTPAPTKMNKGERYDMKMASDQNLKASARKNYAENAEAAQKSSPAKKKKPAADPAKTDAKIIKTNARLKDNLRRSKGPKSDMGPVGKEERRRVMKPVLKGTSIEKSVSLPPVKIK